MEANNLAGLYQLPLSPDSSCWGIWPKVYWAGADPGTSVKVQMTSKRSPCHFSGMTVPALVGSDEASAGMCLCSQQISTTPEEVLTTLAASWVLAFGEIGGDLDTEALAETLDRLIRPVRSRLVLAAVGG